MDPLLILALLRLFLSLAGAALMFWMAVDRDSVTFPLWTRWVVGAIGFGLVAGNGLATLWAG